MNVRKTNEGGKVKENKGKGRERQEDERKPRKNKIVKGRKMSRKKERVREDEGMEKIRETK